MRSLTIGKLTIRMWRNLKVWPLDMGRCGTYAFLSVGRFDFIWFY